MSNLDRRSLLKFAAVGGALSFWNVPTWARAADLPYMDRIGLQLYTVRNQMAEDAEGTLKAIAAAGYRQVELMSIDKSAIGIAGMARDLGLMVHSAFMDWRAIADSSAEGVTTVDETAELAERLGLRHIVFGYIGQGQRDTADKCRAIAEATNRAAEKVRAAGMRLCYHNHSFEFAPGSGGSDGTMFDLFLKRFDAKLVDLELDVFWAQIGGLDPLKLLTDLQGRITQVHLKNLLAGTGVITNEGQVPPAAFKELGAGEIDIPAIMRKAQATGVQYCHVEQDHSPAPLKSIVESIEFLKR
ncbi:MAG: sugar phosphate isomerase/epimerase [Planctomycetaceae bacterium]|nr:sugar phosphate isomerase/epimerase [Planctomycetaceae bacterium]